MEKPEVLSPQSHGTEYYWDCIGPDLTALILSYLPIPSIIVAASVCKFWNSIIHSNSFKTRISNSWFFLSLQLRNSPNQNKLFAFIPESESWIELPNTTLLSNHPITASEGWSFDEEYGKIITPRVWINKAYCQTSTAQQQNRAITVVGIHLVDIRASMAVDFPDLFEPGTGSCSALFKGKLYVLHLFKNWITSFDLEERSWSDLKTTLRPPGAVVLQSLVSCRDRLVLAGLRGVKDGYEFNLWRIDEKTLEISVVGIMPGELFSRFISDGDIIKRSTGMKYVGFGNLVYVFSGQSRVACVCEMSDSGKCRWREVPNMPECVLYHKVIGFTCDVSLDDFLGNGKTRLDC